MGARGTGIKGNDTSADIYDDFFELYDKGENPIDISKKLIADNQELIQEKFDCNNFWLILALAQWETKSLQPAILQKVKTIIESKSDLEVWKELDADDETLKKRQRGLERFLIKISLEKSKPKSKSKAAKPIFSKGECLTFKFTNDFYGGAVVLGADYKYGYNLVATTRINKMSKPVISDFEKSEVLFAKFADYNDDAKLTWLIPQQDKKYAEGLFEIVGRKEVEREYDPSNSNPKATYSGGWNLIIELAEKQFNNERINGKSKKKLTMSELTKSKPFWKFW